MDNNDCLWTPRIEATKEAQKRSRIAFVALIIVSLAFIIANWNASLSWERFIAFKDEFGIKNENLLANEVTKEAQRILLEEWVKSQTISVPFLGLHIGHSDGAVLGSFSLLLISLWFYISMRRENEVIGTLLKDSEKESHEIRIKIFYGVTSYLVFSNFGQGKPIINSLNGSNNKNETPKNKKNIFKFFLDLPKIGIAVIKKFLTRERTSIETPKYISTIFVILFYLPAIAIAFIIISDFLSIFIIKAPFRLPHAPLIELDDFKKKWYIPLILDTIAIVLLFFTTNFCRKASNNEKGTERILKQYEDLVITKKRDKKKDT